MIVDKRKSGIFLTCLGVGMGNYKDSKLETLADKGNGNYAYINDIQEANKVFVNEFGGTLFTIAKDVKIQVEFNPAKILSYRLVGYENRMLKAEDFKDDAKDAGELGAGHTVTAIYEIIPVGVNSKYNKDVDDLKYQKTVSNNTEDANNEVATVKFRYKKPDGEKSIEMVHPVIDHNLDVSQTSNNFKFSASVAMFGMLLRNSEYKGNCTYKDVIELASESRGIDNDGYRAEFIRLVKTAENGAFDLTKN
jgi:Ca-activated chloride channel homolog